MIVARTCFDIKLRFTVFLAALYFQRVLDVAKDDYEIRIMLSKCQQNTFQPFLAHQNHLLALKKSLTHLMVMENEARMLCDNHDEFEFSLIQYLNGARKRVQPPTFTLGTLKVKYRKSNYYSYIFVNRV